MERLSFFSFFSNKNVSPSVDYSPLSHRVSADDFSLIVATLNIVAKRNPGAFFEVGKMAEIWSSDVYLIELPR